MKLLKKLNQMVVTRRQRKADEEYRRRHQPRQLGVDNLEARIVQAADFASPIATALTSTVTVKTPTATIHEHGPSTSSYNNIAGVQDKSVMGIDIVADPGSKLFNGTFQRATGSSVHLNAVASNIDVWAYIDAVSGDKTLVGSAKVGGDTVTVNFKNGITFGSSGILRLEVSVDTRADAKTGDFNLDLQKMDLRTAAGKTISSKQITLIDSNEILHRISQQQNAVGFSISMPPYNAVAAGTKDVTGAVISFTTTAGAAKIEKLPFAIEGMDWSSSAPKFGSIKKELLNVRLVNLQNPKEVIKLNATNVGGSGYQIYTPDKSFIVNNGDTWEVRYDVAKTGTSSHAYRVSMEIDPTVKGITPFDRLTGKPVSNLYFAATDVDARTAVTQTFGQSAAPYSIYVQNPSMNLTIVEGPATATAASNEVNRVGMRIEIQGTYGVDEILKQLSIKAQEGDIRNIDSATLWLDANGDGQVESLLAGASPSADGRITFSNFVGPAVLVTGKKPVILEVHFSVASNLPADTTLRLNIADVKATVSNGAGLDALGWGWGNLTLWNFTSPEVQQTGNLFVTKSTMPLRSQQLLPGMVGDPALALTLYGGEGEDKNVTKLVFSVPGSSLDHLDLYKAGMVTPFGIAARTGTVNGVSTYEASLQYSQLVIPAGEQVTVLVLPHMKEQQDVVTGETIQVALTKVEARGQTSGTVLLQNDGDSLAENEVFIGSSVPGSNTQVIGSQNVVVLAKLSAIRDDSNIVEGSAIQQGMQLLGAVKQTAAAGNVKTLEVNGEIFGMDLTNVKFNANSFRVYNMANMDIVFSAPAKIFDLNGVLQEGEIVGNGKYLIYANDMIDSFIDTKIAAGQSIRLGIFGEITKVRADEALSSSIQLSFSNFNDINATQFGTNDSHLMFAEGTDDNRQYRFGAQYDNTVVSMPKLVG